MGSSRGIAFFLTVFAVVATASLPTLAQQTVFVDDDNCPGPGSGSDQDPYCKIQDAICWLKDQPGGGTVSVRPGTYNEAIRFFPGVSVVSTDGPAATTIDATGQYCMLSDCTVSTVTPCSVAYFPTGSSTNNERLEGFRLTGGGGINQTCSGTCDIQAGGGIFIFRSSPTITKNEIVGNVLAGSPKSYYGAGIYVHSTLTYPPATPVITENLIDGNINNSPPGQNQNNPAFSLGGGIYVGYHAAPIIERNTISNNTAGSLLVDNQLAGGGAISIYTAADAGAVPVISKNVIDGNISADIGGGIAVNYAAGLAPSNALVEDNVIEYNDGTDGGGAATRWTLATFRNNTFIDNNGSAGGGVSVGNTNDPGDQATLANNLFILNTGSVFGGGGIYVYYADPVLSHNDLFGNSPDNVAGDKTDPDYIGFDGNVSVDPLLTDTGPPPTRDLHLQGTSPVVDAGDNAEAPALDFDMVPRIQDGDWNQTATVDMGAFELSPDFDGDGTPDWQDLDDDNDGVTDDLDCDDFAPSVSMIAGSIPPTLIASEGMGGTTLKWDRGIQGFTSNVYRGTIDATPFSFNDACVFSEKPGRTLSDMDAPAVNSGYYYLVSAKNVCGESEQTGGVSAMTPCTAMDRETDGDGILDVMDNCATVANLDQLDSDGDWVGDACDNCAGLANGSQADNDDDGLGNPCDCAVNDPAVGATLPAVQGLVVDVGSPTLTWGDIGTSAYYDVAGGMISDLRVDGGPSGAGCLGDDAGNASWDDSRSDPAVGEGYYYIVRPQTGTCDGSYGTDSDGVERSVPAGCS